MTYCNEELHHKIHKVTKSTKKIFYYIFVLSQVSKYKAKNIRNCFVHPRQVTSPPMIKYKTKLSYMAIERNNMSQYFQSPKSCRRCWFSIMTMFSMS